MIEFSHVSKLFGAQKAVNDLNLNFQEGSFSVLIGTSGSGKSTTLKMINRLVEHDSGVIRFAGEEIRSLPVLELRRRMGYAIQSIGLFPHWSVAQNIATVPQLQKWSRARIDDRIDELMALLGLESNLRERYPHQLSGGQQQRVGVLNVPLPHTDLSCAHRQLQPLFGFILLGDVPHDGEDAAQLALLIAHRAVGGLKAAGAAVVRCRLTRDGDIHVGHAAAHDLLKHGFQCRCQLGYHFSEVLALMLLDTLAIDVGQHLIDFAVAKFAVKDADAQRGVIHQLCQDGVI